MIVSGEHHHRKSPEYTPNGACESTKRATWSTGIVKIRRLLTQAGLGRRIFSEPDRKRTNRPIGAGEVQRGGALMNPPDSKKRRRR